MGLVHGVTGSMSTGTARNGGRVHGEEPVGSLEPTVLVVGGEAGLVGSLEACLLAQRGMEVGQVGRTQWAHWSLAYQQGRLWM